MLLGMEDGEEKWHSLDMSVDESDLLNKTKTKFVTRIRPNCIWFIWCLSVGCFVFHHFIDDSL